MTLRIEFLPADHGDCILVSYGDPGDERWVLIDGGPSSTYDNLRSRLDNSGIERFELVVVSHIDADHIDGIIKLIQDESLPIEIGDFWFNGRHHLDEAVNRRRMPGQTQLGGVDGEILGMLLVELGLPWNDAFDGGPIFVGDDTREPLPVIELAGGLKLTLLGPFAEHLDKLRRAWDKTIRNAGFESGDREAVLAALAKRARLQAPPVQLGGRDSSEANGSSIAFLVEYGGASVLLSGDSFHDTMAKSLQRIGLARGERDGIELDAWKLAHHGSRNNTSSAMLRQARCTNFIISTNGKQFKHPDQEAVDEIAKVPDSELWFNCRSATTEPYESRPEWVGRTHYPPTGDNLVMEFPRG